MWWSRYPTRHHNGESSGPAVRLSPLNRGNQGLVAVSREGCDQPGRVDRPQTARHVVAGAGAEARNRGIHFSRRPTSTGTEGVAVVARGDVDEPAVGTPGEPIKTIVQQAEPLAGCLIGNGDNPGKQRRGLARSAGQQPAPVTRIGVERLDQPGAETEGGQADVGHTSALSNHARHGILVVGSCKDVRGAAASGAVVVPDDIGSRPV